MKTLKAELTRGELGIDVFEVWHDSRSKRTVRMPIGRAYSDVRFARRCAVRHGLTVIDESKLGELL